jgi:hypothetical protein
MVVGIAWNAGLVRARLLGRRRLGTEGCRALARRASLDDALTELAAGPYGHDVERGMPLAAAQWAVGATPLWHLRILAGWLPPAGGEAVRTLAGWWEVHNVENLLAELAGRPALPPYDLGLLDTAWVRLRTAGDHAAVAEVLRTSPWGDPDGDDPAAIVRRLRLAWCERVDTEVERASELAAGWAVLQAARDPDASGIRLRMAHDGAWVRTGDDVEAPAWQAEVRWWRALDERGRRWLQRPRAGVDAAVGAFCVLLADAHRVQGALGLAARGGDDEEAVHALL